MGKILKKNTPKISSLLKMIGINSIRPFTEQPSIDKTEPSQIAPQANHATELFERFTADIIRERVTFVR